MGGQTSRMVREVVEDSLFIMRQTNKSAYQESVAARREVEEKIQQLRSVRKEMFESAEREETRSEMYRQFKAVAEQKKLLDQQAEGFVQQFELPQSYQTIADEHEEATRKAKKETEADKPQQP